MRFFVLFPASSSRLRPVVRRLRRAGCRRITAKRLQIAAQGFSPGSDMTESSALKAAPECGCFGTERSICNDSSPQIGCPFRAYRICILNPGLKPWAILFCPFGAKDVVTASIAYHISNPFSSKRPPLTPPLSLFSRTAKSAARPGYHHETAGRIRRTKCTS